MTNEKHLGGSEGAWLVFVTNLPTDEPASRMRILRTLESLGTAVLRDGVFLLPDNATTRQSLTHLTKHIAQLNGTSHLLIVSTHDGTQNLYFLSLFDRSKQFEELIKRVRGLRTGFGISDPNSISRVLAKQRRDFEAIRALDFFPSSMQEKALEAISTTEKEISALMFPDGQITKPDKNTKLKDRGRT